MARYYSINKFAKLLGITTQTLRNWDKNGKLHPHHTTENGYRYYSVDQLNQLVNKKNPKENLIIGYCRVLNETFEDELTEQVNIVKSHIEEITDSYKIITDYNNGVTNKRSGLRELIELITEYKVSKVVLLYKDRLSSISYEIFEQIFFLYNCQIEVIDTMQLRQNDLVDDLVFINKLYSNKLKGRYAAVARKTANELSKVE